MYADYSIYNDIIYDGAQRGPYNIVSGYVLRTTFIFLLHGKYSHILDM